MIKILSASQIKEVDAYTIKHEPVSAIDLMERAASKAADVIINHYSTFNSCKIICGPGNNGGDGLVIARHLFNHSKDITLYIIGFSEKHTEEYLYNFELVKLLPSVIFIESASSIEIAKDDLVIDALLGSGISRPVTGLVKEVIDVVNKSGATIISIDIPSGMFADAYDGHNIINAHHTLTFQYPKLAFFLPETGMHTGKVDILDIGLIDNALVTGKIENYFIEKNDIHSILKKRQAFSHKGSYGHALIIAGSKGKTGAAILAAKSCIHSGAGMVTACIPACCEVALNTSAPEVMTVTATENYITSLPDITPYTVIGCGPGIGSQEETARMLKLMIQNAGNPLVLDADALNILSQNKTWLSFLPAGSILTPHPGEFLRLAGKWSDNFERLQLLKDFSKKYNCYVVLKDHFTITAAPDGNCYFNSTGNPGMSTAGSGDVLTGIILSLMAQQYHPLQAALLGVYLHGLAGDIFASENSMESLTATGIIDSLGKAFIELANPAVNF